jgi:ribosomal-protein-alanine N-acetyltransferase
LRLRAATRDDAKLLLEWRNDQRTRLASQRSDEIQEADHLDWLSRSLANVNRMLMIAEEEGVPVGTVRADYSEGTYELSWTVAPGARGRGIGKAMVALFVAELPGELFANVKKANAASARIAEAAGMRLEREDNGTLRYFRPEVSEFGVEAPDGVCSDPVMRVEIVSERYVMRELRLSDVTERYLGWFSDAQARRYIAAAASTRELSDLKHFVQERVDRADVLFLGIFDKATSLHIGNIKYEPVNSELGYAVMGVMIGDPAYRGKGVTPEVLRASGEWLNEHRNIRQIVLGVHKDNREAIRAYEKAGFAIASSPYVSPSPDSLTMVWQF